jgi:hypothetical protein
MSSAKDKATEAAIQTILERCRKDPFYFFTRWCRTKDEHDSVNPVKPFPAHPYLEFLTKEWNEGPKLQFVAKSRQLMISWLLAAQALHTAKFRPFSLVLWQSKKEEDANPFVAMAAGPQHARITVMEYNLPEWMHVCYDAQGNWVPFETDKVCNTGHIALPNGSEVVALAQGASQVESKVPTLWISDEASLQPEWASSLAAAKPAIEGDARGIVVGTMRLPSAYGEAIAPAALVDPDSEMRGVARFLSPEGVPSIRLHYSADPNKDPMNPIGAAWKRGQLESGGYIGGEKGFRWRQHMEVDPTARAGTVVLPRFAEERHQIVIPDLNPSQMYGWSFDAGFDWGVRNLTVLLLFGMSPDGNRYLVWEYAAPAGEVGGVAEIAKTIKGQPLFHKFNGEIADDPSMWKAKQVAHGLKDVAGIFGIDLIKAPIRGQEADDIMVDRLNHYYWQEGREPTLYICENAVQTIRTLPLLMYEEWTEALEHDHAKKEKIRDREVDCFDAFKYAESRWPDYPKWRQQAEPGSFAWRKQIDQARARPPKAGDGDLFGGSE